MPRIHTLDMARLTPLGRLIAEYMRQQWPRLQTKAEFAHLVDVRPSTVDNLLYSQHAASTRTLNKIARATGISPTRLYEAAAGNMSALPPSIEAIEPPRPRQVKPRQVAAPPSASSALDEAIARIRATEHPVMAEVMVQALLARAGRQDPRTYWQARIEEVPPWDDHDAVSTLQLPTVPSVPAPQQPEQPEQEQESQPACEHA